MSEAEQAKEPQRDKEGRLLAGRYRLGDVLGRGGMGTVWRAADETLGRTVAVKELRFPSAIDDDEKRRLITRTLREAKAIARIRNTSAVTVYDVVDEDDRPWIVMELVEGKSLAEVIREDGTLEPRRAAEVGLAILDVLRSAHREGILHRDVKPSNVLISDDGRVVLTDFGIAQVEGDPSVTSTGMLVGAPSYISPERARGHKPGPPADLWSLGGLLYASVEGTPPYDKGSAIATLTAVMTEPLDPPKNAGPLKDVIYGLLERDPERRLDDAGARALLKAIVDAPDEPVRPPADATRVMALPADPGAPSGSAVTGTADSGDSARDRLRGALRSARGAKAVAAGGVSAAGSAAAADAPSGGSGATTGAAGTPAGSRASARPGAGATGATAATGGSAAGKPAAASASVPSQRPGPSGPANRASLTDVVPRRTLAIIAGVIVLAVLGTVLALTLGDDDPKGGGGSAAGASASAGANPGDDASGKGGEQTQGQGDGKADASVSPSTDASASPSPSPSEKEEKEPADTLPAGYTGVADDRFHFTMAMPSGFSRTGIAGSNSGGIYNTREGAFPRVQIDYNSSPKDDAAAAWTAAVAGTRAASNGYQHIGVKKVSYNGYPTVADWEFRRNQNGERVRVLNRGFKVDATHGYSIMVTCKDSEWDGDECRTLRETAFATFRPAD
ncbi:serine/threonine-protein kinase [uncultured Streptomyces sp.]|uniref:serine/threonine-protein kinase n=1 Tax=uncultured Streptomyces sp. TaxID=174707 RepID=UPI002636813A|nr:serine/threonine-protein kinase [uncultured Streptomyces sp.]